MDEITLGRSGLRVSRMGLGGGGHSRLGLRTGRSDSESIDIVRRALDQGINFIDTAESYGTEEIVGHAIRGRDRGKIVVSTKKSLSKKGHLRERPITPADLRAGLEQSLRKLGTDYIDVYHLHGLKLPDYERAVQALVPELLDLKDQGKIRAIGVTEAFNSDRAHAMLQRALTDDCWDVIMVGFSILNQSARERVVRATRLKDIGVLCMFAVRVGLSRPPKLGELMRELITSGRLESASIDPDDPLGFVIRDGAAKSIVDAAYRFCRDEDGIHVVLSGTGDVAHLEENIVSMNRPPLPPEMRRRLMEMFGGIDTLSGQ
ncbi:MAG: aldo/keto reductase [Tepidisphaeraceae bacterium]